MKVLGVGIDLIEIERISKAISGSKKFIGRVFTEREIIYCSRRKKSYLQHYAGRYAAKEAVRKALGSRLSWKDVEICNGSEGAPRVKLYGRAKKTAEKLKAEDVLLSISHCKNIAIAQVVVVGRKK